MNELDFWRAEPSKKAKAIANEIELLARRARATGLQVTAYVLELAANEARKDAQMVRDDRGGEVSRRHSRSTFTSGSVC
jgi:hypothetical protein